MRPELSLTSLAADDCGGRSLSGGAVWPELSSMTSPAAGVRATADDCGGRSLSGGAVRPELSSLTLLAVECGANCDTSPRQP